MSRFMAPEAVADFDGVILDCRFSLADESAGRAAHAAGHVPGALHLDLNRHLSAPVAKHGGRHPLPEPAQFAACLAGFGIDRETNVLLYDDANYAFAARCWWMLRALGYRPPSFIDGGYRAWLAAGGVPATTTGDPEPVAAPEVPDRWPGCVDREDLAQYQANGARLVDAREAARYRGEMEPIDPVAGHIPGAENRPWQAFVDDHGRFRDTEQLRALWGDLVDAPLVVTYCGSGVSACVNLLSLSLLGRDDVLLYGGSWSDWCSYL